VELSRDSTSVWDTPSWDEHLIKLGRGKDGNKDDREWIFGALRYRSGSNADAQIAFCLLAQTTPERTAHQLAPMFTVSQVPLACQPALTSAAMDGYNAVIFAYGQTASGKTHTLTGSPAEPGIIPLSIADLFAQIRSTPDREFLLRASYLELYNETIIDLLSPEPGRELSLSEGKKKGDVIINGLTEMAVRTEEEVKRLLRMGEDRRKVGGTDWNARSSRSHCVFRIVSAQVETRIRV
jgi:centromeric protein E